MLPTSTQERISRKVHDLIEINQPTLSDRILIRTIMNGGKEAVSLLLGARVANQSIDLPVPNLILTAMERLSKKLGGVPTLKVEAPDHLKNERSEKAADKRYRVVQGWDRQNKLKLIYPQIGRWLPGYGFSTAVIKPMMAHNKSPYPCISLRDPYETYLGEWGTDQQPDDVAYVRVVRPESLAKMFPELESYFLSIAAGSPPYNQAPTQLWLPSGQAVTPGLHTSGVSSWANQSGQGISVYEYYNHEGVWWVLPDQNRVLLYIPNPLDCGPMFQAVKRFSFDKLIGQYNYCIGLLAAVARINLNLMIGIEDSVHAETNIMGEYSGKYKRGRGAVNRFAPGTTVDRPRSPVPFEAFQQAQRLDDQLRVIANYPVQEDSVSPNSFVTGRGLEELRSSVSQEVQEYFTSLADFQTELDYKRLEYCEKVYPNRKLTVNGLSEGTPYEETYNPSTTINGNYITNRIYGMMTGWDEPTKLIAGLQLLSAEVIDIKTFQENIDGLDNPSAVREAIRAQRAEGMLMEQIGQMGAMGDPRAIEIVLEMMPDGELKNKIRAIVVPEEQPQQSQLPAGPEQQGVPGAPGIEGPESTQTILERLTTGGGEPFAGVQTVRS